MARSGSDWTERLPVRVHHRQGREDALQIQLLQQRISASDQAVKAIGCPRIHEDVSMTLQLGLVGTDGIVLASDLKTLFYDGVQTEDLERRTACEPVWYSPG
jgi:hypothetical protein